MTRTYAAKRLLEHGPLTRGEFANITGWKAATVSAALKCLIESRVAYSIVGDDGIYVYQLY